MGEADADRDARVHPADAMTEQATADAIPAIGDAPAGPARADRSGPDPSASKRRATRALLEVIDRDGHVRQVWPIHAWPARIGRALDNDVVLTDPHVAPHHFSLDLNEAGELALETGDTINGVSVGLHRIPAGSRRVIPHDSAAIDFGAGRSRLRLRLPEAPLAPELPLAGVAVHNLRIVPSLGIGALLLVGIVFNSYLDSDPDTFSRAAGNALLAALSAAAIWCGAWALLSKTITRQSHFSWHLRVFMLAGLTLLGLAAVPGLLAFSLSWPWLTDFSFIATYAVGATALYFHLLAVEPARPRLLRWVVATGAVVGVVLTLWFNLQRTSRVGEELYMSHLFPPKLRLARPLATDRFIAELAPLRALLDKKAKEAPSAEELGAAPATVRGEDDDE
jgi:pSer/pThr/pTyr-binding forkhead associated (FHA) protein